eukprot:16265513-Heterocapsa_arctica.AAC.1
MLCGGVNLHVPDRVERDQRHVFEALMDGNEHLQEIRPELEARRLRHEAVEKPCQARRGARAERTSRPGRPAEHGAYRFGGQRPTSGCN